MKLNFLILFILFLGFGKVHSQAYRDIRSITIKDGLPSNVVYGIKQDSKGFIWATTNKGVVKYDGRKFKLYTVEDGLPSNDNFSILLDSKDNVWLYSFKAVCKIGSDGVIKTFVETNSHFSYFLMNDFDELFFITGHPIKKTPFIYHKIDEFGIKEKIKIEPEFEEIAKKGNISAVYLFDNELTNTIYNSFDGTFYYTTTIDKINNVFARNYNVVPKLAIKHKISMNSEFIAINDSVSVLLSSDSYKLYVCNEPKHEVLYPKDMVKVSNGMTSFFKGDLVIMLDKGVYLLGLNKKSFGELSLFIDVYNPTGFIYDNDGSVWVSTLGAGIFKYPLEKIRSIKSFFKVMREDRITKLSGYKNENIWYSNSKNEVFKQNKNIYPSNALLSEIKFIENDGKNIYYGGSSVFYKNERQIFENGFKALSLLRDSMLSSTTFGLNFISSIDPEILSGAYTNQQKVDINGRMSAVLLLDNLFYCGNEGGLFYGYRNKKELFPICLINNESTVNINGILKSNDGLIWVSTEGYGVFILKDNIVIKNFTKELLDLNIHSMKIDNHNNVWLASRLGVNKIRKYETGYEVSCLTSYHGLPSDYINDIYCYDNHLYVATDVELVKVDLNKINYSEFKIYNPTYIVGGKMISQNKRKKLDLTKLGIFDSQQNSFSFEYTGISHRSNGKIGFEYRLLPSLSNWIYTTNDNVTFNTLGPGTYSFEVRAVNAIGIKSAKPATYSFKINEHYTQTTWFFILLLALLISLSTFIVSTYFRVKRKRYEEINRTQKIISELKLKSLQSQLNPHFIFNSLNAIQQFINVENRRAANDYLARFARLMRLYLGGSENQFISLEQEMEVIRLYCQLEHLRFADKYQYEIKVDAVLDLSKIMVPAMLLQPHVENAIRHGLVTSGKSNNFLLIDVSKTDEGIVCIIRDNGIGRAKSLELKMFKQERHRSLGNKISKERLEVIRELKLANITETIEDLFFENKVCGTEVKIFIGLQNNS